MLTFNVDEAKTHPSRLLARVEQGEQVVIARAGKPVAQLSPIAAPTNRRVFGRDAGVFEVPEDFDESLPEEVLDAPQPGA